MKQKQNTVFGEVVRKIQSSIATQEAAVAEISRSVEASDVTLKGGCSFAQRFANASYR